LGLQILGQSLARSGRGLRFHAILKNMIIETPDIVYIAATKLGGCRFAGQAERDCHRSAAPGDIPD
jgi:hypothetical protein